VILFFVFDYNWLWFLLPVVITTVGTSLWGQEWKEQSDTGRLGANERRELRRERERRHHRRRDYRREIDD
jgi:hypothetical protein